MTEVSALITPPSRAWVIAGGDFSTSWLTEHPAPGEPIICVDRGLEYCLAAGWQPSQLVGDLDSVTPELLEHAELVNVPRHIYPTEKDASDLEIALTLISQAPPQEVIVLGVSGGRTDHMLLNWLLPAVTQWPFDIRYLDASSDATVLYANTQCSRQLAHGTVVSLVALTPVSGLQASGVQYPLFDASLQPGSSLGLSNIVTDESIFIRINEGVLLMIVNLEQT